VLLQIALPNFAAVDIRFSLFDRFASLDGKFAIVALNVLNLHLVKLFQTKQRVVGAFDRSDELSQLRLHRAESF